MNELLFFFSAFISEIIGTIVGFGSSTIFLPISLFFVDFKTALILVALFHVFGNIGRITFFRYGINRKLILRFGAPSVAFTIVGALLVNYTSQAILKFILGIFLLLFSIVSLNYPNLKFRHLTIGGILSGFFAGLIGTGGALRGAFLTSFNLKKKVYIATSASIALLVDITRIPIYLVSGFLAPNFYIYIPLLFITAIVGSYTGKRIVDKIPQNKFRKLVLVAIILVSLKFIYDSFVPS